MTYESLDQAVAVVEACHYKPLFPGGPPMRIAYHHAPNPLTDAARDQYPPSTLLFVGGIGRRTKEDLSDVFARWKPAATRVGTLLVCLIGSVKFITYENHSAAL